MGLSIQQFQTAYKKADREAISDGTVERGYRQVLPALPFHVVTNGARSTAPIKSVSLETVDDSAALILKADDETLMRGPTQFDGNKCLTAQQISEEVRRLVKVQAHNESKPIFLYGEWPVLVSVGTELTPLRSLGRKKVNPRNARLCLN